MTLTATAFGIYEDKEGTCGGFGSDLEVHWGRSWCLAFHVGHIHGTLSIQDSRTDCCGWNDEVGELAQVAFGFDGGCTSVVYCHVAPATRESTNAMVRLDAFPTLGAAPIAIPFCPVVLQCTPTFCFFGFDVGVDTGSRGTLNTTLVDGIFAYWRARRYNDIKYNVRLKSQKDYCKSSSVIG